MVVHQKIKTDFLGRESVEREAVVPDAKPRYPVRHVVDGVALITLPAAQYDALVESSTILMNQSNELIEAMKAHIEAGKAQAVAERDEAIEPNAQAEPPVSEASEMRSVEPIDAEALMSDHVETTPRRARRPGKNNIH